MSISGQNLTIVVVTLKSENVIHQCIKSIDHNIPIIVVENSNNLNSVGPSFISFLSL